MPEGGRPALLLHLDRIKLRSDTIKRTASKRISDLEGVSDLEGDGVRPRIGCGWLIEKDRVTAWVGRVVLDCERAMLRILNDAQRHCPGRAVRLKGVQTNPFPGRGDPVKLVDLSRPRRHPREP